jgi:nicotinamidase-related amidase
MRSSDDAHFRLRNSKGYEVAKLEGRPNAALLVVDMQNDVVAAACDRAAVVSKIASLVAKARHEAVPVVWVRHTDEDLPRGSHAWQIVDDLVPFDGDVLVEKHYGDSFEDTDLEAVLAGLGVGHIFVVGAQTDACIRSTLHGAIARGYDVSLVRDAHTTENRKGDDMPTARQVIALTNRYWGRHVAPGRTAETIETGLVDFRRSRRR